MKSKAIVFDFGNVLLQWQPEQLFQRFFADAVATEAFMDEIGFAAWHLEQDRGRSFADAVAERTEKFPQYAEILAGYSAGYDHAIAGAIAGSVAILEKLKQANYPLYGLSNFPTEKFPLAYAKYPFFKWFDEIVISGEVGLVKPDPAIFHLLLAKIQRTAQECVFIDDVSANIASAQQLGFTAIQFHSPDQLAQALDELGILSIRSIEK